MKLSDYDVKILIAEDAERSLYIVRWGANYKFYQYNKVTREGWETLVGTEDHWNLTNKTQFITNAYDVAIKTFGFQDKYILDKYPRNRTVVLSQSEVVAINTAISLLSSSNSDHADQACCYLKSIINKL